MGLCEGTENDSDTERPLLKNIPSPASTPQRTQNFFRNHLSRAILFFSCALPPTVYFFPPDRPELHDKSHPAIRVQAEKPVPLPRLRGLREGATLRGQPFMVNIEEKESPRSVMVTITIKDKQGIVDVADVDGSVHTYTFDTTLAGAVRCIEHRSGNVYMESTMGSATMQGSELEASIKTLLDNRRSDTVVIRANTKSLFGEKEGSFVIPYTYSPQTTLARVE